MRGVKQARVGHPDGDCYRAAVATVLGCNLSDVPDIHYELADWTPVGEPVPPDHEREYRRIHGAWCAWYHTMNLMPLRFHAREVPSDWLSVGSIKSRSGPWLHAVVCVGDRIEWDPNPAGLSYGAEVLDYEALILRDPRRCASRPTAKAPRQWREIYTAELERRQRRIAA